MDEINDSLVFEYLHVCSAGSFGRSPSGENHPAEPATVDDWQALHITPLSPTADDPDTNIYTTDSTAAKVAQRDEYTTAHVS